MREATVQRQVVDVCVVGGGPAGSTVAGQLAEMGHTVALLEARKFPRPHIGASLPSSIFPLLEQVGVLDAIECAGFVCADDPPLVKWPDLRPSPWIQTFAPGLHIDRGRFDHILLDHARKRGVRVFEGLWARKPSRCPESGRWWTFARGQYARFAVSSRIVIDASGRPTNESREHPLSAPTVAIYGYWTRANAKDSAGRLEAGTSEWMWYAPVSESHAIAAVFVDSKRLSRLDRRGIAHLYRGCLANSVLISPCVKDGGDPIHVCDATSRAALIHATRDFLRVGDSSLKLDPLSSQGIQTAIASAIQASIVCNTLLRRPSAAATAISFYEARQHERLEQHRSKAGRIYEDVASHTDHLFWKLRACRTDVPEHPPAFRRQPLGAMTRIKLAPDVTFPTVPVIDGTFVVRRPAVRTRTMRRPVAYLAGLELVPLLETIKPINSALAALRDLSRRVPERKAWSILCWLWDEQIIVASEHERGDYRSTSHECAASTARVISPPVATA